MVFVQRALNIHYRPKVFVDRGGSKIPRIAIKEPVQVQASYIFSESWGLLSVDLDNQNI
jgi:hypothetical protein